MSERIILQRPLQVKVLEDTLGARMTSSHRHTVFEQQFTRAQLEALLAGKVLSFDVNSQYAMLVSLKEV